VVDEANMSRRTTIGLAIVAGLLALYILVFEREGLSDSDTLSRRGSVFVEFDRERVTRLTIEREPASIVIQRRESSGEEDEFSAKYDLVEPVRAEADVDAVDALLSSIEWAEDRRRLEEQTPEDLARYGLDSPALSGSMVVAGREIPFRFGGTDPQGGGRYLSVADPTVVYVVGNDLFEAFDHDANHFRSRDLFESDALSSAISLASGEVRIEKREGRFWFADGTLASETKVRELLAALRDARALSFDDDTRDPARFGLDRTLRIEPAGDDGPVVVKLGSECTAEETRGRYLRVGEGPVACVSAETVDKLALDPDGMRERRPLAMRSEDIQSIEIEDGSTTTRLSRAGDHWTVGDDLADDVAISELYDGVRRLEAEIVVVPESDLPSYGFGSRAIVVRAEEGTERLELGRVEGEIAFLHRDGELAVLRVPATAAAFFEVSPLHFRDRTIGEFDAAALESLSIARGGATETVRKDEDGFHYEPGPAEIDAEQLQRVARLLAALRAVRWVATAADASHGLDAPPVTVTAAFALTDDHGHETGQSGELELRIGTPTDGGAFARAGENPAVFVVPAELVEALERPLAQGSAPRTPTAPDPPSP
jgi:hypothetical protein